MTLRLDPVRDLEFLQKRKTKDGRSLLEAAKPAKRSALDQLNGLILDAPLVQKEKKRNHLGNKIFEAEGVRWQSEGEYHCWLWLKEQQKKGLIQKLERQVELPIEFNGVHICNSVLDFSFEYQGKKIYADYKSVFTSKRQRWVWQKRMILAAYGIKVWEFIGGRKFSLAASTPTSKTENEN